ncbi:DUF6279 family lipoprotein [Thiosulfativibrio zosterae]|uniref:Lipoprotein n=1 Tax=Thiosulfativibrio zosterae TaxID=2675053 RepID=A0A6F8PN75_9GAMM|nr:DUF6279 family lipoprotein [Thiosulfativibrio zosterae]BBP43559.1 lipoprotein [Thiosulfativibrio zosterae]
MKNISLTQLRAGLVILCLSVLLSACSNRFIYNQLDWLVPWYLSDYVTLENYQKPEFKAALNQLLLWHRQTQLPEYADFLSQAADQIALGVSAEQVQQFMHKGDDFADALFQQFGVNFAPLMAKMTPEQQTELLENLSEKTAEYREKFIEPGKTKAIEYGVDKMRDFLEDWLGDLTPAQQQRLQRWGQDAVWMSPDFYQNRLAWQARLADAFKMPENSRLTTIKALFENRRQFWSDELNQKMATNQSVFSEFLADLLSSLDASQKQYLQRKLQDFQDDFTQLSKQVGSNS